MSLLTVTDVAGLLNVRCKRVRELIHSNHLNAIDITPGGGRSTFRIDPEELRKFQDQHTHIKPNEKKRRRRMMETTEVIEFFK